MRFDLQDQLSNRQVFTATAVSTNSKMKKKNSQDLASLYGKNVGLVIATDKIDTVGGAATFEVQAIEADDAALTTNQVVLATRTFTVAQLAKGKTYFLPIPPGVMAKKYYGAKVVVTGGASPSATLNIYVGTSDDVGNYKSFESPYTVQN